MGTDYQSQYRRSLKDVNPPMVHPETVHDRFSRMKVLDADARIFMFENFFTDEECDHIIDISTRRLARSGVVAAEGGSEISDIRTSSGVFLGRGEDRVIQGIEERIAAWTLLPVGNGEGLQVLKYNKRQKYDAHWDYFFHKDGLSNGGNRYATVLTYLADTEEGGETVFPNIPAPGGRNPDTFSECARYHLAAKPKKGTAILFHSIKPTGELERKSLHTACPVIKGVKWSAAKWIHVGHYSMGEVPQVAIEQKPDPVPKVASTDGCDDHDDLCEDWAAAGECERNPSYMIGTRVRLGKCVRSCKQCDLVRDSGAEQQASTRTETSDPASRQRFQS